MLKLERATARATGACTRDRGNWVALIKPEGRTARVATRKTEMGDMLRGGWVVEVDEWTWVRGDQDGRGVDEVEVRGSAGYARILRVV